MQAFSGIVPWIQPTTADIIKSGSRLARTLPLITSYILDGSATFTLASSSSVEAGVWTKKEGVMLLAVNLDGAPVSVELDLESVHEWTIVLESGVGGHLQKVGKRTNISLDSFGVLLYVSQ